MGKNYNLMTEKSYKLKQWNTPKIQKLMLVKTEGSMVSGTENNPNSNNGHTS